MLNTLANATPGNCETSFSDSQITLTNEDDEEEMQMPFFPQDDGTAAMYRELAKTMAKEDAEAMAKAKKDLLLQTSFSDSRTTTTDLASNVDDEDDNNTATKQLIEKFVSKDNENKVPELTQKLDALRERLKDKVVFLAQQIKLQELILDMLAFIERILNNSEEDVSVSQCANPTEIYQCLQDELRYKFEFEPNYANASNYVFSILSKPPKQKSSLLTNEPQNLSSNFWSMQGMLNSVTSGLGVILDAVVGDTSEQENEAFKQQMCDTIIFEQNKVQSELDNTKKAYDKTTELVVVLEDIRTKLSGAQTLFGCFAVTKIKALDKLIDEISASINKVNFVDESDKHIVAAKEILSQHRWNPSFLNKSEPPKPKHLVQFEEGIASMRRH